MDHYMLAMYALGGTHNILSLFVLISYFLSNHPRLPTKEEIKAPFRYSLNDNRIPNEYLWTLVFITLCNRFCLIFRTLCGGSSNGGKGKKTNEDLLTEKKADEISKLDVKFFSFTTFYYMVRSYKNYPRHLSYIFSFTTK